MDLAPVVGVSTEHIFCKLLRNKLTLNKKWISKIDVQWPS